MVAPTPLVTITDIEQVLCASEQHPVVVFKHSMTCPISAGARRRILALDHDNDPPLFEVVVQRHRDVSAALAEQLNVRHESPQVLVIQDRSVIYHTSHGAIDAETVRTNMEDARGA